MNQLLRWYHEKRLDKLNRRLAVLSRNYEVCASILNDYPNDSLVADRAVDYLMEHDKLVSKQNKLVAKLKGEK